MYCNSCGARVPDNAEYCTSCGAKLPARTQASAMQNQGVNPQALAENAGYKMKWFKFLIYFSLFASAVLNFVYAVQYLSGSVYGSDSAAVYSCYSSLKAIDVFYGLVLIALGVFNIYTRFQLSTYKKTGPACLLAIYGASAVIAVIYVMAVSVILGESCFDSNTFTSVAGSVVMILVNRDYFNKRQSLFVN